MRFATELALGRFCIPECTACKKIVWPASDTCGMCLGRVSLRSGDFEGRVLECSGQGGRHFCLVEFEGAVRVIAEIPEEPKIGQAVRMRGCGVSEGAWKFYVS